MLHHRTTDPAVRAMHIAARELDGGSLDFERAASVEREAENELAHAMDVERNSEPPTGQTVRSE